MCCHLQFNVCFSFSSCFLGAFFSPVSPVRSRTDCTQWQHTLAAEPVGWSRFKSPCGPTPKTAINLYFVLLHQFSTTACMRFPLLGFGGWNPIQDPQENKHIYVCETVITTQGSEAEYPLPALPGLPWGSYCAAGWTFPICQITVIVFPIPTVIFSELMHLTLLISFSWCSSPSISLWYKLNSTHY